MKTIGLIGGLSWQSTLDYYRILNELIQNKLGGRNAGKIILNSVNFSEIEELQIQGNWKEIENRMVAIGQSLEKSGAEMVLICANTMHKIAPL